MGGVNAVKTHGFHVVHRYVPHVAVMADCLVVHPPQQEKSTRSADRHSNIQDNGKDGSRVLVVSTDCL